MITNIPKIRFNNYNSEYNVEKLGKYAKYRRGSFPQPYGNKEWYDGEDSAPFVQVFDVGDNLKLLDNTKSKISKKAQPMSVKAKKGQVLVTLQGTIGRVAVMQYDAFVDRTILIFESFNKKTNSYYFANIIKLKFIEEARHAPGGIIKTITKEALSEFELNIPEYTEQNKIGVFINNIDELIDSESKKLQKLKDLKSAMLSKMFPKKGSRVPEVRFKGFSGEWEEKRIEEFADFMLGKGLCWEDISIDGKYECILYGNLYTDYGMIADEIKYKTSKILLNPVKSKSGDVLIPSSDTTPIGLARATAIEREDVLLGGGINVIRPHSNINGSCLSLAINSRKKELIKLIKGTTVRHIYNYDIKDVVISIPKTKEEQNIIVKYFKELNFLIEKEQQKLEKLTNLKQAFLSKMFV